MGAAVDAIAPTGALPDVGGGVIMCGSLSSNTAS
jgi:hypothetical protein